MEHSGLGGVFFCFGNLKIVRWWTNYAKARQEACPYKNIRWFLHKQIQLDCQEIAAYRTCQTKENDNDNVNEIGIGIDIESVQSRRLLRMQHYFPLHKHMYVCM